MPDIGGIGKWIVVMGLALVVVGVLVWGVSRLGLPIGRLPGDFNIQRGGLNIFFPCATSICLSIVLTVLLNLAVRLIQR
jgi:hypothetical protein